MIWLTWRQIRTQFIAVYALLAAAVVTLAITGNQLRDLAKSKTSIYDLISSTDRTIFNAGILVMTVVPAIIGIFWGAPLVARELEAGTHRLVWNQSVTRTRWLAIKLGISTVAVAVAIGILTFAVSWWAHPLDGAVGSGHGSMPSRMTPTAFAMRGVVPVGYAVFALVLGTVIGIVLRRSVPAMAVTLALYVVVQIAVPLYARPHLVPPASQQIVISDKTLDSITSKDGNAFTITAHTGSHKDWILSNETVDAHGKATALPSWFEDCLPRDPHGDAPTNLQVNPGPGTLDKCFTRLEKAGYRQHVTYQPDSHFWPLQWTETAMYVGISALLAGFGFWWTRRKLS
jgi:ABC-type transport system involved in multi-copper enzyme maturation permease subunit